MDLVWTDHDGQQAIQLSPDPDHIEDLNWGGFSNFDHLGYALMVIFWKRRTKTHKTTTFLSR
jgi:hypothetical protein